MFDLFNLDVKIWCMLLVFMVLGRFICMFFEGKQQCYVWLLWFFFVFMIIIIVVVSFFEVEFVEDFFVDVDDVFFESIYYGVFVEWLDIIIVNFK